MDLRTVSLGVSQAGNYEYMLEIGQSSDHFNLLLKPGEEFEFPEIIIQKLVGGSLPQTAVNLQRYFLLTDTGRFRVEHPVVYNPWFEHYALLNVDRLKQHVQAAKELGCEVFEIDAGWYGSQPGDWWSQAGDWNEKTDGAFYGNMKEFVNYVKAQGLKFGLWMEPERIGEATPIRKRHPEYFAEGNGFYYPKLYLPEAAEYLYKEITGLIEKYGLSWMKMDFNFEFGEDGTASEFYLYYKAWYSLLEKIKSNYPEVFLEACAAGGMRNDLNTTTVYDGHFLSDNVNSWDMQAAYQQCCLRLPHYRLIKWLVVSPGAKISLYDSKDMKKKDSLITTQAPGAGWDEYEGISAEFACQLTMSGPVGLSGNFIEITGEQKQVLTSCI
jgi:alpha-galactosidase